MHSGKFWIWWHRERSKTTKRLAFSKNLESGYERDGAAFAVCHKGKMVVDIWGGYADRIALRPWKEDTLTTAFSCTKVCRESTAEPEHGCSTTRFRV